MTVEEHKVHQPDISVFDVIAEIRRDLRTTKIMAAAILILLVVLLLH